MRTSLSLVVSACVLVASTVARAQRVTDGLVTLYDFTEAGGTIVGDTGPGDPMDLEIDQADLDQGLVQWIEGSGLAINLGTGNGQDGGALVRSAGAATKVYEAIAGGSNALTLEAWVTPELDDLMVNISRMFTMSADTGNRNFTLGTTGDGLNYVNRLRNTTTDVNGSGGPGQLIGGEVRGGVRQHVVFSRDADGTETIYVDGELVAGPREIAGNLADNWDATYPLGLGNEITRDRKFNGTFHLAAVYNRALSGDEVLRNFLVGGGGGTAPTGIPQLAGDCNQDGSRDLSDVICMVKLTNPGFLLIDRSAQAPPCSTDDGTTDILDLSGDSRVDGSDIVLLADFLFGGSAPPAQGLECFGVDEALGCEQNSVCPDL